MTLSRSQPDIEPVAWRWKPRGNKNWIYDPADAWRENNKDDPELEFQPLYATPPSRCDAGTSWLPIATAPKDGTPILAANSRHDVHAPVVVRWDGRNEDGAEPHWCDAATAAGDALYFNSNYFDLWMPAPVVPSADRGAP